MHALDLEITTEETLELQKLVEVVWKRIQTLDLPDSSAYGDSVADNKQFVADLMNGDI